MRKSTSKKIRDIAPRERVPCEGWLRLRPSLENKHLSLELHHIYHKPYESVRLSTACQEFIDARISSSSPSQIYRGLLDSETLGVATVSQHQVYYRWKQANPHLKTNETNGFPERDSPPMSPNHTESVSSDNDDRVRISENEREAYLQKLKAAFETFKETFEVAEEQ
ncbi:hypothetical protein BROUX41_004995 [Berkeleyomyces rouxiae]|uniref:uncharacterized protein n=1 Tax=Berkeleyomyces rouxiae TaxID=2035830 RepID=UPI003B804D9E